MSDAPLEGRSKEDNAETAASQTKIHRSTRSCTNCLPTTPTVQFQVSCAQTFKIRRPGTPAADWRQSLQLRARERSCCQDRPKTGPSKDAKDRDKRPPHFSTAVPHQVRSSEGGTALRASPATGSRHASAQDAGGWPNPILLEIELFTIA